MVLAPTDTPHCENRAKLDPLTSGEAPEHSHTAPTCLLGCILQTAYNAIGVPVGILSASLCLKNMPLSDPMASRNQDRSIERSFGATVCKGETEELVLDDLKQKAGEKLRL
jgi:hypothetical protein